MSQLDLNPIPRVLIKVADGIMHIYPMSSDIVGRELFVWELLSLLGNCFVTLENRRQLQQKTIEKAITLGHLSKTHDSCSDWGAHF